VGLAKSTTLNSDKFPSKDSDTSNVKRFTARRISDDPQGHVDEPDRRLLKPGEQLGMLARPYVSTTFKSEVIAGSWWGIVIGIFARRSWSCSVR
jgi:hypothetical protein